MRGRAILLAVSLGAAGCGRHEAEPKAAPPPPKPEVPREFAVVHRHPRLYERDTADLFSAWTEKMSGSAGAEVLPWARERLAEAGVAALPAIRNAFTLAYGRPENAPTLSNLCEVLGLMRSPEGVGPLREALTHPNGGVRESAMRSLAAIGSPEAVGDLGVVFEQDPLPAHRRACLRAMAAPRSQDAAGFLRSVLANPGFLEFHRDAVDLLAAFPGPLARPGFREALARRERVLQLAAAKGLAVHGDPEAIAKLEEFARSPEPGERVEAAAGLGAARRLDLLAPLSRDQIWMVRAAVAAAVGIATGTPPQLTAPRPPWMAPPPAPWPEGKEAGVAILRSLLGDGEPGVRTEACRRLCALGERDAQNRYLDALNSPDATQVREALEVLVEPSIRGVEAIPAILARLGTTQGAQRRPYLQALGHLRDPRGAEVLAKDMREAIAVRTDEGTLADYAALMLSNLGEAAIPYIQAALALGQDPDLRRRAARAATFMPVPAAGDLLLEVATRIGEDPTLRAIAIRAAPRVAGPRAAAPLKRALYAEPDPAIRNYLNCVLHDFF